jgi:hypothetical protein
MLLITTLLEQGHLAHEEKVNVIKASTGLDTVNEEIGGLRVSRKEASLPICTICRQYGSEESRLGHQLEAEVKHTCQRVWATYEWHVGALQAPPPSRCATAYLTRALLMTAYSRCI